MDRVIVAILTVIGLGPPPPGLPGGGIYVYPPCMLPPPCNGTHPALPPCKPPPWRPPCHPPFPILPPWIPGSNSSTPAPPTTNETTPSWNSTVAPNNTETTPVWTTTWRPNQNDSTTEGEANNSSTNSPWTPTSEPGANSTVTPSMTETTSESSTTLGPNQNESTTEWECITSTPDAPSSPSSNETTPSDASELTTESSSPESSGDTTTDTNPVTDSSSTESSGDTTTDLNPENTTTDSPSTEPNDETTTSPTSEPIDKTTTDSNSSGPSSDPNDETTTDASNSSSTTDSDSSEPSDGTTTDPNPISSTADSSSSEQPSGETTTDSTSSETTSPTSEPIDTTTTESSPSDSTTDLPSSEASGDTTTDLNSSDSTTDGSPSESSDDTTTELNPTSTTTTDGNSSDSTTDGPSSESSDDTTTELSTSTSSDSTTTGSPSESSDDTTTDLNPSDSTTEASSSQPSTETTTDQNPNSSTTEPSSSEGPTSSSTPSQDDPPTTTEDISSTTAEDSESNALPLNNPHHLESRSGIVHLHEWKFSDIAKECEDYLGPNGFAAVQTSPVNENLIIAGRPWYERYQPMSYDVNTRSGDAKAFLEMTQRCRKAGVLIYVDVVPNHMTANAPAPATGTAGNLAHPSNFLYPAVPYNASHFNQPTCQIKDFNNPVEARVCELVGLHDLNQGLKHVQKSIVNFLNYLTALGAAGFRVDAAKHMYPEHLKIIYSDLNPLSQALGFPPNSYPFVYQEVGDGWKFNYTHLGAVTEFAHATNMAAFFKSAMNASALKNYGGPHMGMLPDASALVFVDNHDLQRQNPYTLNYKSPREFKAAYAFTLAHPYGIPRVMSSFDFKSDQDGPPHDKSYNIKSPRFHSNGQCRKGWVCEHRWTAIKNMITFRNEVGNASLTNFWADDEKGVVSFCRGKKGFVIISSGAVNFEERVPVCLPPGVYCNSMITRRLGGKCENAARVVVRYDGTALIRLPKKGSELAVALHMGNLVKADVAADDEEKISASLSVGSKAS